MQAIDHLERLSAATSPSGRWAPRSSPVREAAGASSYRENSFADSYIFFIGGLFGRYGSSDLTVMLALLRLFETVVEVLPPGSTRLAVLDRAVAEALADAERSMPRPPSLERIRAAVKTLRSKINSRSELKSTSAP